MSENKSIKFSADLSIQAYPELIKPLAPDEEYKVCTFLSLSNPINLPLLIVIIPQGETTSVEDSVTSELVSIW